MSNSIASSMEGQYVTGTVQDDYIVINHQSCKAYGEDGNDIIVALTDNNDLYGGGGNDNLTAYGNITRVGSYDYTTGDDTLCSTGISNSLIDTLGSNLFIVSGDNNTARGGIYADTFWVYSYNGRSTNVTLTGGGNNDTYVISTGLASVQPDFVGSTPCNPYNADTVNAAITDFDAFDTLYIRDYGLNALNCSVTAEGTRIYSDSGRVNILLAGQTNWDAIKSTAIIFDDAQGNVGAIALEQAGNLSLYKVPAGVYISGDYMNISSSFVGHLMMSGAMNYYNGNIVTMDATTNPQNGMMLAGNEKTNAIYAGTGGNVLWGGSGFSTQDYLYGGAGADVFFTGKNDGTDLIFNADVNDTINLYDTNLSDIVSFGIDANSIALSFNTGNVTAVATGETLSPRFQLADGSAYRFNRATNSWQTA